MNITPQLIDQLKEKHGLRSDYAVAKMLGISTQRLSNYRTGRNRFDDLMAYKVAELLELDPAEVIAQINMERAKRPEERKAWKEILERLGSAAAVVTLGVSLLFPAPSPAAQSQTSFNPDMYYANQWRRRRWWSEALDLLLELLGLRIPAC